MCGWIQANEMARTFADSVVHEPKPVLCLWSYVTWVLSQPTLTTPFGRLLRFKCNHTLVAAAAAVTVDVPTGSAQPLIQIQAVCSNGCRHAQTSVFYFIVLAERSITRGIPSHSHPHRFAFAFAFAFILYSFVFLHINGFSHWQSGTLT